MSSPASAVSWPAIMRRVWSAGPVRAMTPTIPAAEGKGQALEQEPVAVAFGEVFAIRPRHPGAREGMRISVLPRLPLASARSSS